MSLKDQIAADAAIFLNPEEFGEPVLYKPAQGQAKSINALFDEEPPSVEDVPDGQTVVRRGELTILTDATAGIAAPSMKDKVTIRGKDWAVEAVPTDDGTGLMSLRVVRSETVRKTHEGTHIKR